MFPSYDLAARGMNAVGTKYRIIASVSPGLHGAHCGQFSLRNMIWRREWSNHYMQVLGVDALVPEAAGSATNLASPEICQNTKFISYTNLNR